MTPVRDIVTEYPSPDRCLKVREIKDGDCILLPVTFDKSATFFCWLVWKRRGVCMFLFDC